MKLTDVPVPDVPVKVMAVGAPGALQGLLPLPVQLIYCGPQSVVPVTVIVAVSLATTLGVYCTYTGVAVNEVPYAKLVLVLHVVPLRDTRKSPLDEDMFRVPAVRDVPVSVYTILGEAVYIVTGPKAAAVAGAITTPPDAVPVTATKGDITMPPPEKVTLPETVPLPSRR